MVARSFGRGVSRRRLLRTAGVTGTLGLAGCLDDRGSSGDDGETVTIAHPWTSGDSEAGISALVEGFREAHPDVSTDVLPIFAEVNLPFHEIIERRLADGDPPGSFTSHPGGELATFDGHFGDIVGDTWDDSGLPDAHPSEIETLCRYDGDLVAVPVGAYRANCLFYNVDVVERAGVDPNALSGVDDLLAALDRVAANADAIPLAHSMVRPWTTLQLVETTLLARGGADAYERFVDGEGGADVVRAALETVDTILSEYVGADADSASTYDAYKRFQTGEAAFLQQGNWAVSWNGTVGPPVDEGGASTFGDDWDAVPFPGTEGQYDTVVDSFAYPVGPDDENPAPEATRTWLGYVASREGQRLFNAARGSVPTRIDVETTDFGPYFSTAIREYETAAARVPSISHGLAVTPDQLSDMKSVVAEHFAGPFDVESTAQGLMDAARTKR